MKSSKILGISILAFLVLISLFAIGYANGLNFIQILIVIAISVVFTSVLAIAIWLITKD